MKKYIKYIGLILMGTLLFSCNKDSFNYKPGYVGISKITHYPVVTITGNFYILVPKGGAYTELGATAKAGTATVPIKTSTLASTATPGVYTITYTATNEDGFSAIGSRRVIVYDTDATAASNDYSGDYARSTNGSLATWTKLAPGVYSVFNPGGAPGTNFTAIVFNNIGSKIFIPQQDGSDGNPTSSVSNSSTAGPGGTLAGYKMAIVNPNYGTQLRIFTKQ